jgi:hypothetical protein
METFSLAVKNGEIELVFRECPFFKGLILNLVNLRRKK